MKDFVIQAIRNLPHPDIIPFPFLYALSDHLTDSAKLVSISLSGAVTTLFDVGGHLNGGLAAHPVSKIYYAIGSDAAKFSTLYTITLAGVVEPQFGLGMGFDGGLAYRYTDGNFYALASDTSGFSTLYEISLNGSIKPLFGVGMHFQGGLTCDPAKDVFYAVGSDQDGFSWLYRLALNGEVKQLFGLGYHFRGGLAWHPGEGVLYAISTTDQDFGMLQQISLSGAIRPLFGVGLGYSTSSLALAQSLPGQKIWVHAPLSNERYVTSQQIKFEAAVTLASASQGYEFPDGSGLVWQSDKDGVIGHGASFIPKQKLSTGSHQITVSGYGLTATFPLRMFTDLWELYQSAPADGEMDRLCGDFQIEWVDGSTPEEQWVTYAPPVFDQTAIHPSKIVSLARLDILRRQRFSKPLPFSAGKSLYDHIRSNTKRLDFTLGQELNHASGGRITFDRAFSKWDCYLDDHSGGELYPYTLPLQLLVHESRHNEPGDPGHTSCPSWHDPNLGIQDGMDSQLNQGSGFSWAAIYLMWVYKYGLDDPANIKQEARAEAVRKLRSCFCNKPQDSNPDVQAIIDELLAP